MAKRRLIDYSRRVFFIEGSTGLHTVIKTGDGYICSCPAFHYHKRCSHVRIAHGVSIMALEIDELIEENVSQRRVFKSSLNAINELFGDEPYTTDTIFMVFALPNTGKTLLMLQEATWFEAQGLNVLIVDTEGSLGSFAKKWLPVLRARFKDVGKKKGKIYGVVRKGIESVAEFFGWKVELAMKGSKIELVYKDKIKDNKVEAWQTLKEKKIDVLIMDSVTMPIRRIPSSPQNLPVKSDLEGFIMGQLMLAQDKFNVAVLATSHASINPTNPYDTSADLRGGLAIKHTAKHVMYIEWRKKKGLENIRQFWLVRRPDAEPWSMVRFAEISDLGYNDMSVSEDDLEELLTGGQLKRLKQQ